MKAVAIMDRAESYTNHGGPLGADVMSALYRAKADALAVNYIYGLGGRDVRVEDMEGVFEALKQMIADGDAVEQSQFVMYCAVFMKVIKQSSEMQQDVWKYPHLHTHTQHGKIATFIMHLKMQAQL